MSTEPFDREDQIECPHCGCELGYLDDLGIGFATDEDNEIGCDSCDGSVIVRVVTVKFTVSAGEKS